MARFHVPQRPRELEKRLLKSWIPAVDAGAPSWFPLRSSMGNSLGTLAARRTEVRPFTPAQIKLLKTLRTKR